MMAGYTPDLGAESIMKGVMAKEPPGYQARMADVLTRRDHPFAPHISPKKPVEDVKHTAAYQSLLRARDDGALTEEEFQRAVKRLAGEVPSATAELQADVAREGYAVRRGDQAIDRDRMGQDKEPTSELTTSERAESIKEYAAMFEEEFKLFGVKLTPSQKRKGAQLLRQGKDVEGYLENALLSSPAVVNTAAELMSAALPDKYPTLAAAKQRLFDTVDHYLGLGMSPEEARVAALRNLNKVLRGIRGR
jgi:hypothetical protein